MTLSTFMRNILPSRTPLSDKKSDEVLKLTECLFKNKLSVEPTKCTLFSKFLPPANEVCEGYVFTGVCLSTGGGGMHGGGGGHAWRGACVVGEGGMHGGGCAWQGACVAGACIAGGMHGRRHTWQGLCMVGGGAYVARGHA